MRELNPHIELQHTLAQQIFNALQGEVTEDIRQKCLGNANDKFFRSAKEGNSLKVNETLLPHFYALCKEVQTKLEFVGDIDFYITSFNIASGVVPISMIAESFLPISFSECPQW